jgi:hypothetical protein
MNAETRRRREKQKALYAAYDIITAMQFMDAGSVTDQTYTWVSLRLRASALKDF